MSKSYNDLSCTFDQKLTYLLFDLSELLSGLLLVSEPFNQVVDQPVELVKHSPFEVVQVLLRNLLVDKLTKPAEFVIYNML
jgi:hypothetical protein